MSETFAQQLEEQTLRLRRYASSLARDRAHADDLVQETLLQVWKIKDRVREGPGLIGLLCKILHDKWVDDIRDNAKRIEWSKNASAVAERNSTGSQLGRLQLRDLDRAIATLPRSQQEAVRLVAQMSHREAAAKLDIPIEEIYRTLSQAREQLRRIMGEPGRKRTPREITADERQQIKERLEVSRNASEVAREFGRHSGVVWRIAKEAEIELTAGYAIRHYRGRGVAHDLSF
jgi:RNA polymerase sigma factor (sigma-70 family)